MVDVKYRWISPTACGRDFHSQPLGALSLVQQTVSRSASTSIMKLPIQSPFSEGLIPRDLWRRGALSFAAAALFTFSVNFSFTIWTMTQDAPGGVGLIWEGEQTIVKAWNTAMHIVINIISTILLAGSNYCMQCLMAPTRSELARHTRRRDGLMLAYRQFETSGALLYEEKCSGSCCPYRHSHYTYCTRPFVLAGDRLC